MARLLVGLPALQGDLEKYSSRFDLVELRPVDAALPKASTLRRWRKTVPPSFVFSVVLPKAVGELSPGPSVETDDEILDWVRRDAETALHPSCTAKMGVDELSVVDPATMRAHGVDALRVVDASVFPYVTNGNIYAPVMMVAEKAADLIRGDTPLAPAEAEFYRHDAERAASR